MAKTIEEANAEIKHLKEMLELSKANSTTWHDVSKHYSKMLTDKTEEISRLKAKLDVIYQAVTSPLTHDIESGNS